MSTLRFLSIGSSSSGNCYYVGTEHYGFLFDAGVNFRTVKRTLKENNIALEDIYGVFITHDHTDHIKYAGVLGEIHNIPIYSTKEIIDGINRNPVTEPKLASSSHLFKKCEPVTIKDFTIQSFPTSHDASDSVGYAISYDNKTLVIATDLGFISKEVADQILKANFLVIETNYDKEMLKNGPYPYNLKQRVNSHTGHLSNEHTAHFLADNWHKNLSHVFLCHISGENNTLELAYQTVSKALAEKQITPKLLIPLPRLTPTEMFILK
jgi:phosphoribosyl 1,2-cyclic phosphodiesterase